VLSPELGTGRPAPLAAPDSAPVAAGLPLPIPIGAPEEEATTGLAAGLLHARGQLHAHQTATNANQELSENFLMIMRT
jgi:hypothetical protein